MYKEQLMVSASRQRLIQKDLSLEKIRAQLQAQAEQLLKSLVSLQGAKKVSYANVCRVKCDPKIFVPSRPIIEKKKVVMPLNHDLTRRQARQDYSRAVSARLEQRQSNNLLIASITARLAKRVVLPVPRKLTRTQAVESARAFSRARRNERQANNYLAACIAFRYGEQYEEEIHAPCVRGFTSSNTGSVEKSIRGPCKATKKPITRVSRPNEDWDREISVMKNIPFLGLVAKELEPLARAFSKTQPARFLFGALLSKLLEYKGESAYKRLESYAQQELEEPETLAEPQMDEIQIVSGNAPTKPSSESTAIADSIVTCEKTAKISQGFYEASSSLETQNFKTFTSRWIYLNKFTWEANKTEGTRIYSLDLLHDLVRTNMDSQALAIMLNHKFYRTGVRVRLSLNSNMFQIGKLVIGYLYNDEITSSSDYNNLYSTIQRPHVTLFAGQKMGTELVIPYRYLNSSMSLVDKESFAKVVVFVQEPLSAGEKTVNSCTISVHVTLEDSSFNGLCSRLSVREVALAEPQMDTIESIANMTLSPSISGAVNVATSVLKTIGADNNRDLPPVPLQPMSFVPQATGSLCYTNNILEPVNSLRGDASGQVPRCYPEDEMSIEFVKRQWGLLKSFTLTSNTQGLITGIPAVPLHVPQAYSSYGTYQGLPYFIPAPIAALAANYSFFRGEIEFRFEFIASQFHKAKLMVSCVPYTSSPSKTLDEVKYSANKIYDLDAPGDKLFTAPWQWKNAFCPIRNSSALTDVPSTVYVHIVNEVLAIAQVPQNIKMNVYIRGGQSFEVAVQRPSLLSSYARSRIIPPSDQILRPYNTEAAQYLSYFSNCKTADGKYPLVPTIQNVVNGFTGYTNLKAGIIYKLMGSKNGQPYRILTADKVPMEYATYDVAISTANAHGLIVAPLAELKAYIKEKDPVTARSKLKTFWTADGPWSEVQIKNSWVPATGDNYPIWQAVNDSSFELIGPEMEEPTVTSLVSHPSSTSNGMRIFGEECPDLKSCCHRYQVLGTIKADGRSLGLTMDAACSGMIRVHPKRDVVPVHSADNDNRWGSGQISYIGSWYRFWRGSLRYKFVVVGSPPEGSCLYVSYCHDQVSSSTAPIVITPNVVKTRLDLLNLSYATYMQALSVNSVFTIEVPFYSEKECLSLYPTVSNLSNSDNGCLRFWIITPTKDTVHIDVLYSLGDDCRFYSFSGIPQSFDLSDMAVEPDSVAEPQMDEVVTVVAEPEIHRENFLTRSVKYLSDTINTPRTIGESVRKATEAHVELCGDVKETLRKCKQLGVDFHDKIKDLFVNRADLSVNPSLSWADLLGNLTATAFEIVSHIIYAIIGGTKSVICFALFNILRTLFGLSFNAFTTVSAFVSKTWSYLTSPTQRTQGLAQPQMEDEDIIGYGSLIFTAIATFCSVKVKNPCSPQTWADGLFCFSKSARAGGQVGAFLKDNLTFINRAFNSFMGLFGRQDKDFNLIAGVEDTRLRRWLVETSCLLAPANEGRIAKSPSWIQKVFELNMVGRALTLSSVLKNARASPITNLINSYMKELRALEIQLVHRKVYSSTRYEPFCLWIAGSAGSGKSTFGVDCCDEFARVIKYAGACSYHPMVPGVKYVDGGDDQPSWFFDDALSMNIVDDPLFIPIYLCGKSPCILRLPYSRVEDKDRIVNMSNLVYVSNIKHFDNVLGIHDIPAFNRRRDLVLIFEFRHGWNESRVRRECLHENTRKPIEDMEHVQVKVVDPISHAEIKVITPKPGESYRKTVLDVVMDYHAVYHRKQASVYEKRHQKVQQNILEAEQNGQCFDDHIKNYIKTFDNLSKQIVDKFDPNTPNVVDPGLESWLQTCEIACGGEELAQPEMPPTPAIYRHRRVTKNLTEWIQSEHSCLHRQMDPRCITFSGKNWMRPNNRTYHAHPGCPFGPCTVLTDGKPVESGCAWNDPKWKSKFLETIVRTTPFNIKELNDTLEERYKFPQELVDFQLPEEQIPPSAPLIEELDEAQGRFKSTFKKVGDFVFDVAQSARGLAAFVIAALVTCFYVIYKVLVVITTIVIGLSTISRMFSGIFGSSKSEEPQLAHSGDYTTVKSARTIRQRTLELVRGRPEFSTVVEPPEALEGILAKIFKNTVILTGLKRDGDKLSKLNCRCTALHGKTLLIVKHYFDYFAANGFNRIGVSSHKANCYCEYDLSELNFEWAKGGGYGTCTLPASYPTAFKNITNLICSESFGGMYPIEGIILENNLETRNTVKVDIKMTTEIVNVADINGSGAWSILPGQAFKYDYAGRGKCGSLLLAPSLNRPIIGIHTSGNGVKTGYAELLRRETFTNDVTDLEFVEPQLQDKENVYGLDGFYNQVGSLEKPVSSATETSIRPSEIQGVFPVATEPAPLVGSDPRLAFKADIFKIGVSRRCQPTIEFPREDVKLATQHFSDMIMEKVKPMRTPVVPLTVAQAIEGLPIKGMAAPITMSTAEGFPWKNIRPAGQTNKSWMFKLDTHEDGTYKVTGILKDLQDTLDHKMEQRSVGKIPCSYFTASLKDSRVLKEKVSIPGKTRIFEISPIDLTIAQRQMFYDYISSYVDSRVEHTIGINPDGYEWSNLANELTGFSECILTADYSAYGPRLAQSVLEATFDVANVWSDKQEESLSEEVKEERFLIREALKFEVSKGLHVAKDLVFRPSSGLPSGNCETVNKNSQANSIYIRIAFLGMARKYAPEYADLYWFEIFVKMFSNGDDLIIAVKKSIIDWFNNVTLIEFFAQYDIKMTDALKNGQVRPFCSIEEATYLKRGFLRHPTRKNQWLAPLERSSVMDTANWINKSLDPVQASFVNSEMCSRLAYTLGPEEYELISSKLKAAWASKGHRFNYPLWETLDRHVWDGTEGPKYSF